MPRPKLQINKGDRLQKDSRLKLLKEGELYISPSGREERMIVCICDCGNIVTARLSNLRNGVTKSCGCIQIEKNITHGLWKKYPILITTHYGMLSRCYNESNNEYPRYGGRKEKSPITVDFIWREKRGHKGLKRFIRWALKNGWRKGLELERVDNDGSYSPKNCKWTTKKEQSRNKRTTKWIIWNDKKEKFIEIWEKYGKVSYNSTRMRIHKLGWNPVDAILTPKNKKPIGKNYH